MVLRPAEKEPKTKLTPVIKIKITPIVLTYKLK